MATLRSLITAQGRTLSKPETWGGTPGEGFNAAAYLVDDGKGASRVEVLVAHGNVKPSGKEVKPSTK